MLYGIHGCCRGRSDVKPPGIDGGSLRGFSEGGLPVSPRLPRSLDQTHPHALESFALQAGLGDGVP